MTGPGGWNSPYPDFLGIGAQKSGTTWLSHNLRSHPEIRIPEIKEIHYFDDRLGDPANAVTRLSRKLFGRDPLDRRWRRLLRTRAGRHLKGLSLKEVLWDLRYFLGTPGDGWYASLFEPDGEGLVGEITPAYSTLDRDTIAHVHELMPEARIIFMMRNPIERAWSQAARRFYGSGEDPAAKYRRLRRHFDSERSRLRTDYLRTLENWSAFYAEERIFVGFLEDVHFFPEQLLRGLYSFLGVDPSFVPPGSEQRVHARSICRVPTEPLSYLARLYREEISRLEERFGGYTSFWSYCAERLVEDPPEDGEQPYPLWETPWWYEWKGSLAMRPQSGPLFSVQATP